MSIDIQELAIALVVKGLNPTVLNADFLQQSGLIPPDWKLAQQPIYNNMLAQFVFQNGIQIVAQPNRVMFMEAMGAKAPEEMQVPGLVSQYVNKLPNAAYQAVGINPRGVVQFAHQAEGARKYMLSTLLSQGSWQEFGQAPMEAALQLTYSLEKGQLNLGINTGTLQLPESETVPVVVFSGNFNYELVGDTPQERLGNLKQVIQHWQTDLNIFQELVEGRFLQQDLVSATPGGG